MDNNPETQEDIKIQDSSQKIAFNVVKIWKAYCAERRNEKNKADAYRKGPIPIEDLVNTRSAGRKPTYGTLDSDVEDLEFEEERQRNGFMATKKLCKRSLKAAKSGESKCLASCQALIFYFATLGKNTIENQTVDLKFILSLLESGADINFGDRYGQTIMHEIARGWHPDVAKFAIQHGANMNKGDYFGRTPLHLASAVNYPEMVEFLVMNGGN